MHFHLKPFVDLLLLQGFLEALLFLLDLFSAMRGLRAMRACGLGFRAGFEVVEYGSVGLDVAVQSLDFGA